MRGARSGAHRHTHLLPSTTTPGLLTAVCIHPTQAPRCWRPWQLLRCVAPTCCGQLAASATAAAATSTTRQAQQRQAQQRQRQPQQQMPARPSMHACPCSRRCWPVPRTPCSSWKQQRRRLRRATAASSALGQPGPPCRAACSCSLRQLRLPPPWQLQQRAPRTKRQRGQQQSQQARRQSAPKPRRVRSRQYSRGCRPWMLRCVPHCQRTAACRSPGSTTAVAVEPALETVSRCHT